jgi:hypothetical protein
MCRAVFRMLAVASWLLMAALAFWVPFRPLHLGGPDGPSLDLEPLWGLTVGLLERRPISHGPAMPEAFREGFAVDRAAAAHRPPDPAYASYMIRTSTWQLSLGPILQEHHALFDYSRSPCIRGERFQPYAIGVWHEIRLPYWVVIVACLAPTVLQSIHVARTRHLRRRLGGGQCVRCGYDLRATPHRCPECGLEVVVPRPLAAG